MKKKIVMMLSVILVVMMGLSAFATNQMYTTSVNLISAPDYLATQDNIIKVQLDGANIDFKDENGNVVNPEILNNRTMVPMRKIFEAFEMNVEWNGETRTIVANNEEKVITLAIGNNKATIETKVGEVGTKEIELDVAPTLLNSRTMVPVRFIAESLEKEVGWDAVNRTVIIIDFDKLAKELEEKATMYSEYLALQVEEIKTMKTSSEIEGKIVYKDPQDKSNNETVKLEGELDLNLNHKNEMEMELDFEFSGKGKIFDAIKEAGYQEMEIGYVIANDKIYIMTRQNGKDVWSQMENTVSVSDVTNLVSNQPKNCREYLENLKETLGELNVYTYEVLEQNIDAFAKMYNNENLKITGTASNKTITLKMNLKDFLGDLITETEALKDAKINMLMTEKISNNQRTNVDIKIEIYLTQPETKEVFELELELDMDIKSINKEFEIKLPEVK